MKELQKRYGIITAAELAELLRVSRSTLLAAVRADELPGAICVGLELVFLRDAVERWLKLEVRCVDDWFERTYPTDDGVLPGDADPGTK